VDRLVVSYTPIMIAKPRMGDSRGRRLSDDCLSTVPG
jgi:hypothetical protein